MSNTNRPNAFMRTLAVLLAVAIVAAQAGILFVTEQPWYYRVPMLVVALLFGWGLVAYALDVSGPFAWGRNKRDRNR